LHPLPASGRIGIYTRVIVRDCQSSAGAIMTRRERLHL